MDGSASMKWWGKVAGSVLGYAITGPVGLVIGAALGHRFDQGLAQGENRQRRPYINGRTRYSGSNSDDDPFFQATFRIMGHLAKADGRVSEAEIEAARHFMRQLDLSPDQVKIAINYFNEGKSPLFSLERSVAKLKAACRHRRDLVRSFLEIQVQVVLVDGNITPHERQVLWTICRDLGVSRVELAQIEALMRIRMANTDSANSQVSNELSAAYETLGLTDQAEDDEIKNQYRRLMNAHHPDKLVSQGADESSIKESTDKVHAVRAAYDQIKKARGLK